MDRSNDIYQKVTDQIIAELENGNVPWIRPWRDGEPPFPINALSGRPYHGINVPLLWNSADKQSFASDRWLTFHQVSALGGQVRQILHLQLLLHQHRAFAIVKPVDLLRLVGVGHRFALRAAHEEGVAARG